MSRPQPTARLMLQALRGFEQELSRRLDGDGYADITVAQTNVLRHLNPEGMKLSDLAADAGISKQAGSQAVKVLASLRLVRVQPDPDDRRAKRVVYTRRGRAVIERAVVHVMAIEAEWQAELGKKRHAAVRMGLASLRDMYL